MDHSDRQAALGVQRACNGRAHMHGVPQRHGAPVDTIEEANDEAARLVATTFSSLSLPRRATAIREHVRVKAARDPPGARAPRHHRSARSRSPHRRGGRIQAAARARRRRAPAATVRAARPLPRTVPTFQGSGPCARDRDGANGRPRRPPRRKARSLCWLPGSVWLIGCDVRVCLDSRLRPRPRAQPPGGFDRPASRCVSRQVARPPLGTSRPCMAMYRGFALHQSRARTGWRAAPAARSASQ